MAIPTTIDIETRFNLRAATPVFLLQNLTPIVAEGILLTAVKGNFKIVDPLGSTVYENTSTVTPDLISFAITSITHVAGVATVTCTTAHGMITGDYVLVGAANQAGYNIQGVITKVSSTVFTYLVDSGTVTPATGTIKGLRMSLNTIQIPLDAGTSMPLLGDYTITLTSIIAAPTQAGTYVKEFTYTNAYVRPTVSITQSVNCFIARFVSTDSTSYASGGVSPTITRTHNITFPAESEIPVASYSTQRVQIDRPKVWNGIYITSISSLLSYTFADDLIVLDTVTGTQSFTVSCQDICNINCCLNDANNAYKNALSAGGANSPNTGSKLAIFNRAMTLAALYQVNIQCGNNSDAATNLQDILTITGCTADCDCGDNGEVVPYDGFIGKTILQWDEDLANSQYDYINYLNDLYYVLNNATAGQNPIDDPELYQIIGVAHFDSSNTAAVTSTGTLNKSSGVLTVTHSIAPDDFDTVTLSNNLITATSIIDFKAIINAASGNPVVSGYACSAGSVIIQISNINPSDAVSVFKIPFQIIA